MTLHKAIHLRDKLYASRKERIKGLTRVEDSNNSCSQEMHKKEKKLLAFTNNNNISKNNTQKIEKQKNLEKENGEIAIA